MKRFGCHLFPTLLLLSAAIAQQPQWKFANGPYCGEVHKFAIDPRQTNIIYAAVTGGSGLYKSTDGGTSWYDIGPPDRETGSLQPTVAIDPVNSSTVYYKISMTFTVPRIVEAQ
jgi:hypothetical protein